MSEHLQEFVTALEPLGERLGPLLVQMPADFIREPGTAGVLDRFLAAVPHGVRVAMEFRHSGPSMEEIGPVGAMEAAQAARCRRARGSIFRMRAR